MNAFHEHAVGK